MRSIAFSIVLVHLLSAGPVAASEVFLTPPVDAAVAGRFSSPAHPFGAGHRGIDYAIPEGSSVRAAGAGTVTFAGTVAGERAVTIDHGDGLETTYSWLSDIYVSAGDTVRERTWIGRSGTAHGDQVPGLHFGVKKDGRYVDPLLFLGPLDTAGAIALAPLDNSWPHEDRHVRRCRSSGELPHGVTAPNDNVAVVIGGITSATDGTGGPPDLFRSVGELGYSRWKTYLFSYRGVDGKRLHAPYDKQDTFYDLRLAGARLREVMHGIAERHPGADVDVLAHSQGGIVARTYLAQQARAWDASLPRVEHLVTFASPHQGVPAAAEIDELRSGPLPSKLLASGMDLLSRTRFPVPPPGSPSVLQLRSGSQLIEALGDQDVVFGTRVLALSTPNDLLVPAQRAEYPGKPHRTVPSSGVWGHSGIVESRRALQLAHAFLGGAGPACPPEIGFLESKLPAAVDLAQSWIGEGINLMFSLPPW